MLKCLRKFEILLRKLPHFFNTIPDFLLRRYHRMKTLLSPDELARRNQMAKDRLVYFSLRLSPVVLKMKYYRLAQIRMSLLSHIDTLDAEEKLQNALKLQAEQDLESQAEESIKLMNRFFGYNFLS